MVDGRQKLSGSALSYYPLEQLARDGIGDATRLPITVKILLEGLRRGTERGQARDLSLAPLARWPAPPPAGAEVASPAPRILSQLLTGVRAVVDLPAMRS